MQTFLPYPDFKRSARVLDSKRLNKQIIECLQIARATTDPSYGWQNHPAVNMWRGHLEALKHYAYALNFERLRRINGIYIFDSHASFEALVADFGILREITNRDYPRWFGNERFHASHRSNLLRKDAKHYGKFGWEESDNLPYYWPTKELV